MGKLDVAVIVPCWNEGENVALLVQALERVAKGIPEHLTVVLVDDGSSDDTWQRIHSLADGTASAQGARVGVVGIRLLEHQGKGTAQAVGVKASLGSSAVVLMDGDGQHPVEALPEMLDASRRSGRSVIGSRRNYSRGFVPALGTWALGIVMRVVGSPFDPSLSEYIVLTASDAASLSRSAQLGVAPLVPLIQTVGGPIETVPVEVLPRFTQGQKSRWSFTSLWHKALLQILADPWRLLPRITILAVLSFLLLAVVAVAAGIHSFAQGTSPGTVAILLAVVVLAGLSVGMWVASMVVGVMTLRGLEALRQRQSGDELFEVYAPSKRTSE